MTKLTRARWKIKIQQNIEAICELIGVLLGAGVAIAGVILVVLGGSLVVATPFVLGTVAILYLLRMFGVI